MLKSKRNIAYMVIILFLIGSVFFHYQDQNGYQVLMENDDSMVMYKNLTRQEVDKRLLRLDRDYDENYLEPSGDKKSEQYREYLMEESLDSDDHYKIEIGVICEISDNGFLQVAASWAKPINPEHNWEILYDNHKIANTQSLQIMERGVYTVPSADNNEESGKRVVETIQKNLPFS